MRLAVCLVALIVAAPTVVVAQESDEIERELRQSEREAEELRGDLGELRSELTAAEEHLAEISARLADARGRLRSAEGQVALGEAALDEAREEQEAADAAHRRSQRRLERTEEELEAEEAVLIEQIVRAFKYGTSGAQRGAMVFEVLQRAEDPNAFAVGMQQMKIVVDSQDQVVQDVFALRDQRERHADEAARDRAAAIQAAADAEDTLATLEELRAEAAEVADEVAEEEAAQAAFIDGLEVTEAETEQLLARTTERRDELAAELAVVRAEEERAAAQRRAEEEAARRAQQEAAAGDDGGNGGNAGNGGNGGDGGGTSGGRLATPGASGGPGLSGIVCPVQGAVAGRDFSNDWGYPRSGGRYHQGNDIFAPRGTPVVAVADGEVIRWNPPSSPTGLGGITVTYRTHDGSEWYNAHLADVAPGIEPGAPVSRGDRIGSVGNSGNAASTPPHLHLGRRHGGAWVNPWPTISPVC